MHSEDIEPAPAEFATFYRNSINQTFRIAYRMARGDERAAREATQEAYARLLRRWEAHEILGREDNARHVAGLAVRAVADAGAEPADDGYGDADRAPESVRELIDSQPTTRRAVAVLFFLVEYPAERIAAVLDVAESEVLADVERMRVLMKPLVDGGRT